MSIFDVIKYPISDFPDKEEFAALPEVLYNKWLQCVGWRDHSEIEDVWWHYDTFYLNGSPHEDIVLLRKMIEEYEPIHSN